jgi:hypothetical protein
MVPGHYWGVIGPNVDIAEVKRLTHVRDGVLLANIGLTTGIVVGRKGAA